MSTFKLGRIAPKFRRPRLKLANYLLKSLPLPPESIDYTPKAAKQLSKKYLNNILSCCVVSGLAHTVGTLCANVGIDATYTDQEIIDLYSAIGGYIVGDPSSDQGCNEEDAFSYWQHEGAPKGSHKISGWIEIDATNDVEVKTAIWLFENAFFGVSLPNAWTNNMDTMGNGFVWDVQGRPNPESGHCFTAYGYENNVKKISTWGMLGFITDAAIRTYAEPAAGGALYTVLSKDSISKATKRAPCGFDFTQLAADFNAIGG